MHRIQNADNVATDFLDIFASKHRRREVKQLRSATVKLNSYIDVTHKLLLAC